MSYRGDSSETTPKGCCDICEHKAHRKNRCKECPSRSGCNAGRRYVGLGLTILLTKTAIVYWLIFRYLAPESMQSTSATDVAESVGWAVAYVALKYVVPALVVAAVQHVWRRTEPVGRAIRECAKEMEREATSAKAVTT